jgi:hypothetical protein
MKNNFGNVKESHAAKLVTAIGDPSLIRMSPDLGTEGIRSIILLDLSETGDLGIYEEIFNNKEEYEVLEEVKHHGRYTVFVSLNFIRKTPWPPKGRLVSSLDSSKRFPKSPGKKKSAPKKGKKKKGAGGAIGFTRKTSR